LDIILSRAHNLCDLPKLIPAGQQPFQLCPLDSVFDVPLIRPHLMPHDGVQGGFFVVESPVQTVSQFVPQVGGFFPGGVAPGVVYPDILSVAQLQRKAAAIRQWKAGYVDTLRLRQTVQLIQRHLASRSLINWAKRRTSSSCLSVASPPNRANFR